MLKKFTFRTGVIAMFLLFLSNSLFAQDPEFTQFYANPLYLNPAFAGTAHCPRVSINYRNQWPGISGSFITTSASYDQHVDALSGGVGLLVMNDQAGEGTMSTTNVSGMYSYQIPVGRRFSIKAGLQATWAQKSVDWSKLTFGDMIDARRGFIYDTQEVQRDQTANYVDFSAGVLGYSEKYFVGFAVHHLTQPDESVIQGTSPLPRKYTFHAGAVIPVQSKGEPASLSPNLLIQMQGNFRQINYGMYFSKGPIIGGLWYRNSDSFIALIGLHTGILKFGYSYDITVSKLTQTSAGSHELSLGLTFDCKPKKRRFRTISCPSF
jgi:type IX secretion system PorP/SprF family membrane protein